MSHRTTIVAVAVVVAVAGGHVAQAQPPGRQPPGQVDQQLEDRLFVRLARDSRLGSDIQVRVRGGVVILTGSVPGERARVESANGTVRLGGDVPRDDVVRTAIETVRMVPGVRSVQIDVEVDRHIAGDRYPYSPDPYGSFP